MAGTITIVSSAIINNGSLSFEIPSTRQSLVQTGQGRYSVTLVIPASDTVIDLSAIASLGRCWIKSLEPTPLGNFLDYGPAMTGALVPFARLLPGEQHELRLTPGIILRALADTAPVTVDITLLED